MHRTFSAVARDLENRAKFMGIDMGGLNQAALVARTKQIFAGLGATTLKRGRGGPAPLKP